MRETEGYLDWKPCARVHAADAPLYRLIIINYRRYYSYNSDMIIKT